MVDAESQASTAFPPPIATRIGGAGSTVGQYYSVPLFINYVWRTQMSVNRILVLEDDESIATDIQQRLEKLGYAVCEVVHSGETLLARVETLRPDLVIMSMSIQTDLAQHESTRHLLDQLQIPVLYSTMHADPIALQSLTHKKPFCYVRTPLDDQDLHRAVGPSIGTRRKPNFERWSGGSRRRSIAWGMPCGLLISRVV